MSTKRSASTPFGGAQKLKRRRQTYKKSKNCERFKVLQPNGSSIFPLNFSGVPQGKCQICQKLNLICESKAAKHERESYITCDCDGKQQFLGTYVPNSHAIQKRSNGTYHITDESLSSLSSSSLSSINNGTNSLEMSHTLRFGKFKGKQIKDIIGTKNGLGWCEWAVANITSGANKEEIFTVRKALEQYRRSTTTTKTSNNDVPPQLETVTYISKPIPPDAQKQNYIPFHVLSTVPPPVYTQPDEYDNGDQCYNLDEEPPAYVEPIIQPISTHRYEEDYYY